MIKIAIVGNIASGKSQVEEILQKQGFKVFDSDKIAHNLLYSSAEVLQMFPQCVENGIISRVKLADLVFNDAQEKEKLEKIIHPQVRGEILKIFEELKDENIVFVSVPLLFEAKMEDLFDKTLFVYADDEIRLKRLMLRNNLTESQALSRLRAQDSQESKLAKCDFVVKNDSTLDNLDVKVKKVLSQLI